MLWTPFDKPKMVSPCEAEARKLAVLARRAGEATGRIPCGGRRECHTVS